MSSISSFSILPLLLILYLNAVLHVFAVGIPGGIESNGQFFTEGLAIIDAPAPNSTQHAGSNISIAIDVSGDGRLPALSSTPGSDLATRLDSLQIFLVSSVLNVNLTIVSDDDGGSEQLLTQEPGSTVKHINWIINSSCVMQGSYNLTFYEFSHLNDQAFFSITPLPLTIENNISPSSSLNPPNNCPYQNSIQVLPQASFPPQSNIFLASPSVSINTGIASPTDPIVAPRPFNSSSPSSSGDSSKAFSTIVVTNTITMTMIAVSVKTTTATLTSSGQNTPYTTVTETNTDTFTTVFTTTQPSGSFIPINGASRLQLSHSYQYLSSSLLLVALVTIAAAIL